MLTPSPRIMKVAFTASETDVGVILADLGGRVHSVDYEVVQLVDGRSRKRPKKAALKKRPRERLTNGKGEAFRKRLLSLLSRGPRSTADLAETVKMPWATVQPHLKKLEAAKLIKFSGETRNWRKA